MAVGSRKKLVVVGLGMVGIAFIEKVLKLDARSREYDVVVIGEEAHVAYNRVGLTSFFQHRQVEKLYLNPQDWYATHAPEQRLAYHLDSLVTGIDAQEKRVRCANGLVVDYDVLVLATGSGALLPTLTPGHDANGVFVYRTIEHLQKLVAFGEENKGTVALVVGGGLLGLEAAKAMTDLACYDKVRLVERNGWLLSRQLDAEAGGLVVHKVRQLGLDVLLQKRVRTIKTDGENNVSGVVFDDGDEVECSTICFAIGVRPRDQLAKGAGIKCADAGGGIVINDDLSTTMPGVFAIGECACWKQQTFGLIAPGVEMAEVLAFNLTQAKLHAPRLFKRPDLSTKLKLLGVDVASFGDFFADRDGPSHVPARAARAPKRQSKESVTAITYKDPFQHVYKKYLFTADGKYLLGGMMTGDTSDFIKLVALVKQQMPLDLPPAQLILGAGKDGDDDGAGLDDDTQICSCHNVSKGQVVDCVKDGSCKTLGQVQACTRAGTGCAGCVPLLTSIFNRAMTDAGATVSKDLCAHFGHSRPDLYRIMMVKRLRSLAEVMAEAGTDPRSDGCEACKPAVASILASVWNQPVMEPAIHGLQDTNDRFLGNIQRNGTFSVVPRVAAGEITPRKLMVIAQVAQDYDLYTKITGGQRIDMLGARKQDLPAIWTRLVDAGMESGHAYAKSLRTVKSCVGSTWCRFGIGDSVGMAVRLEERYKSIRSPHKIKGGVSGCVRECAEAQSKDFGLIATDKGFNIYVGGNGGATPKHAQILAKDVPPADVVPILDRYLMFYIRTADKLQRTARWLESLPGGLRYLQDVILADKLGICSSLEAQMQDLVDSYFDEWADAIRDPAIVAKFRQFANTADSVDSVELVRHRDQTQPAGWAHDNDSASAAGQDFAALPRTWSATSWQPVLEASHFAGADDVPNGISATIIRGDTQLAVWRFRGTYYATQQMCPHRRAFVLSDGLLGHDPASAAATPDGGTSTPSSTSTKSPWVSCPLHKRNFDLTSGACRSDPALSLATFQVEERAGPDGGVAMVYLKLPPIAELDAALGTRRWMVRNGNGTGGGDADTDTATQPDRRSRISSTIGRRARKTAAGGGGGGGVRPVADMLLTTQPTDAGVGCGAVPDW